MNVQKQREEELSDTQKANTRKTSISGGEALQRFVVVVLAKKKIMTFWYLLYIQMNFIAGRKNLSEYNYLPKRDGLSTIFQTCGVKSILVFCQTAFLSEFLFTIITLK